MDRTERLPTMDCSIVDVFAEQPLAGNQLAVVRGCGHLDTATMQAIAREMNFSETTFVVEERSDEARVRIFTPARELPFAGHPTLGTAWVLGRDRGFYSLDLAAGRVRVTFEAGGIAWMQPPPVELGDTLGLRTAAALLGLAEADFESSYPCRFATIGPWFVLVGVKTLDALQRVKIHPEVYEDIAAGGGCSACLSSQERLTTTMPTSLPVCSWTKGSGKTPQQGARTPRSRRICARWVSAARSWWSKASRSIARRGCISKSPIRFVSAARCARC